MGQLKELDRVELKRQFKKGIVTLAKGTKGTVVHCYPENTGMVEIEVNLLGVFTITSAMLEKIEGK
jgi:hypothetical protein